MVIYDHENRDMVVFDLPFDSLSVDKKTVAYIFNTKSR